MNPLLTYLRQSFAAWQASSSTKRHSNASLREQAVKCLSHCTYREVSQAIGMSINTLRSWQKSICSDQSVTGVSPKFIAINLNDEAAIPANPANLAEIRATRNSFRKPLPNKSDGACTEFMAGKCKDEILNTGTEKQERLILQINLPSGISIKVESTSIGLAADFITALGKESSSCFI